MKNILTILMGLFTVVTTFGQDKNCCDTYAYEGCIFTDQNTRLEIKLNFLVLLDSSMVGSYYYNPSWGSLKLVGQLNPDNSFYLIERDQSDSITGYFDGQLEPDFKKAVGKWTDGEKRKNYRFEINQLIGSSFWDYIKKNRALFEYKDMKTAIKEKDKVLSINLEGQGLKKLPNKLSRLDNIFSINLLGNEFVSFPTVLSKLISLDELSLSSNKLNYIGPEIGNLQNLRILIMNFNQLTELPKEIGELTHLLYLEIGNNQLTTLPDEIKYLTSLQELHLESNKLSDKEKERIKKLLPKCVIYF
jgi:Leucine-rich repeat (LRR) protein